LSLRVNLRHDLREEREREHVKAPADDSVLLLITHSNLSTFSADIRISQQTTVEALKDKL
jgi:hypothetical protein